MTSELSEFSALHDFLTKDMGLIPEPEHGGTWRTYFYKKVIWHPLQTTRTIKVLFDQHRIPLKIQLCVSSDNNNSVFVPAPFQTCTLTDLITNEVARLEAMHLSNFLIRPATQSDVPQITECVQLAYESYIALLEMKPNPMLDNYSEIIENDRLSVLVVADRVVGIVVLEITDEGFLLNNIAVHPDYKGQGYGRVLLGFAEEQAIQNGFKSIYLYTNVKMLENQAIYAARGYVEYARRDVNGRHGVFMRKTFAALES